MVEAPAARELLRVVGLLEAVDFHHIAGVRSVDELVASERYADVMHIPRGVAEEDEVPGAKVLLAHGRAVRGEYLLLRGARDPYAHLGVRPLHQARAVEAGPRTRAAPLVPDPKLLLRLGERAEGARPGRDAASRRGVDQLARATVARLSGLLDQ